MNASSRSATLWRDARQRLLVGPMQYMDCLIDVSVYVRRQQVRASLLANQAFDRVMSKRAFGLSCWQISWIERRFGIEKSVPTSVPIMQDCCANCSRACCSRGHQYLIEVYSYLVHWFAKPGQVYGTKTHCKNSNCGFARVTWVATQSCQTMSSTCWICSYY